MNSKGSILLDVLAGFFTCLLIAAFLIPMLVKVAGSANDANKRLTGIHLLYERLKNDESQVDPLEIFIHRKGAVYKYTLQIYSGNPGYMEGCIGYVDSRNNQQKLCDITPKR
ncbi:hypothetical protein [Peribacillus alkalitolerans]|uniref:hypothetical protein n=1 Tax=Peribacillus alkalitolerans TaxID=1550385 RepID=UPI0013D88F42|nr:hypothetical protein [Peribacillus alkalitolerans]